MEIHGLPPRRGRPASGRFRAWTACSLFLPLSAGCGETLTEVESGVVGAETWPALKIESALPAMGDLAGADGGGARHAELVDRWASSWDRGTVVGGTLREEVHADARALLDPIDSTAVLRAIESVRGAVSEVRGLGRSLPPPLVAPIEEAARFLGEAERAGAAGKWTEAGLGALRAADALRETSPRATAITLVEAAEDALGPPPSAVAGEPTARARARRLAWWSRIAIQRERYALAIQRGYYACLLLGVRPS